MKFSRKGYGAIFTDKQENVELIRHEIELMDEFEFSYLPDGLVRVFDPTIKTAENGEYVSVKVCYTHKFDSLDLNELVLRCWRKGIHAWYMEGNYNDEYVSYIIKSEAST